MGYYVDADRITLEEFYHKVQEVSILPSQKCLKNMTLEQLQHFSKLRVSNVQAMRALLKKKNDYQQYSDVTSLSVECIVLLRREIERYFPRPIVFAEIPNLSEDTINKLKNNGYLRTDQIYESIKFNLGKDKLAKELEIENQEIEKIAQLVDLSRIMWSTPTFVMLLYMSGYHSLSDVINALPDKMLNDLLAVNNAEHIIKSKLRKVDIELFIRYAKDVPNEMEWYGGTTT